MSRKNQVMFSKPDEPAFLKRIKARIGYKEGPSVNTKSEKLPDASDDDYADRDDEKPVVVLPKNSRITEQEAEMFMQNYGDSNDDIDQRTRKNVESDTNTPEEHVERLVFKKPDKIKSDEDSRVNGKTTKRTSKDKSSSTRSKMARVEDDRRKVNNSRLLSFGEDEDDE